MMCEKNGISQSAQGSVSDLFHDCPPRFRAFSFFFLSAPESSPFHFVFARSSVDHLMRARGGGEGLPTAWFSRIASETANRAPPDGGR